MTPHPPSTPSAPQPEHPDIEALADLAEQLTDPADEAALRRHLDTCAECADTFAALAEVRELLGEVEAPPMPADVAERIDTALAAARTELAASPAPPAERTADRPTGRTPGTTAPPAGRPAGVTGPGSTGPGRGQRSRRRVRLLLATVTAAAAIGFGALLLPLSTTGGGSTAQAPADSAAQPAAGSARKPALTGGTAFQDDTLIAQAQQLVRAASAAPGTSKTPEALAQPNRSESPGGTAGSTAPSCAAALTGQRDRAPLAVAPGRYHSSAVTALVYPDGSDRLDVYLITPDCSAPGVLLHRTVPAG
ncbi:anti-sigma factor family protein [Kitasatospora sp. DSM 101779]|uniref:anti-sigma factor family protein n=1 Tax=Kitasatospora sp. DSM 101779 TaxID=2853165 RepID=UPI0021DA6A9B|nr:hypothetical protein [Kitasatospora sp. DSM 101779]MCU7823676.1 hypothetical protein [Kitasatospora sp. DSM 101779]